MSMAFWGAEVKSGVSLSVDPGDEAILHISQAALGEKKDDGNEPVCIYLKVGDQKLIIGTLSHDKFPQLSTEIVLEKRCELSHSWKNGSVYFSGYTVDAYDSSEDEDEDDDELAVAEEPVAQPVVKQVNIAEQDDDDSDEDSSDTSEDSEEEEEKKVVAKVESDEDEDDSSDEDEDEDEDDSSDDDTPKKAEETKKRSAEGNTSKKPSSNKKAKFVTPEKSTESKKPHVHIATPHPSKQGGKNSGESSKQKQTPKSGGAFGCNSCNRTFTTEVGLQSHSKAKHSAAA